MMIYIYIHCINSKYMEKENWKKENKQERATPKQNKGNFFYSYRVALLLRFFLFCFIGFFLYTVTREALLHISLFVHVCVYGSLFSMQENYDERSVISAVFVLFFFYTFLSFVFMLERSVVLVLFCCNAVDMCE